LAAKPVPAINNSAARRREEFAMKRSVLAIPLDEIRKHLQNNSRQDIKIVAPEMLGDELFGILRAKGKSIKREQPFEGIVWKHSSQDEPNNICESGDFVDLASSQSAKGAFALSFANERAAQDEHFHKQHFEIYFSEHPLAADFRILESGESGSINLDQGGAIIFAPGVIHKMRLGGLTFVIETPSTPDDKASE
jgi:hypothetical protein